jgi:hypothetical protein
MDWSALMPVLARAGAPLLGKAIGFAAGQIPIIGPLVGPMMGDAIGGMIAKQFGVEATPTAVANAIASNPDDIVRAKLAAATEEAKVRWPAIADIAKYEAEVEKTQVLETGKTMRAELDIADKLPDGRTRTLIIFLNTIWRPLYAFEWLFELFISFLVIIIEARTGKLVLLTAIKENWELMGLYLSLRAGLLGYHMKLRTEEKTAGIETPAKPVVDPNMVASIIKAVSGR